MSEFGQFPRWWPDGSGFVSEPNIAPGVTGHEPVPFDNDRCIFHRNNDGTHIYNRRTGTTEKVRDFELVEKTGANGEWAGVAGAVIHFSDKERPVIPNAGQPWFAVDGSEFWRTGDSLAEPTCGGGYRAWKLGGSVFVEGHGQRAEYPGEGLPRLIKHADGWALSSMTDGDIRVRKSPFDVIGWEQKLGPNKNLNPDGVCVGRDLRFIWHDQTEGHRLKFWQFSLDSERKPFSGTIIPNPGPPPPPEPVRMPVPDKSLFIASFLAPRLRRLDSEDATRAHTFEQVNACVRALALEDPNWGLLEKPGGPRNRAADIGLYRTSLSEAQVVDLVADAEGHDGLPQPAWSVKDIRPIVQWHPPFTDSAPAPPPPPQPPPVQPPPAVDLVPLLGRLDALTLLVQQALKNQDAAALEHETDRRLLQELLARPARPATFPNYEGRILGVGVTLRPKA